MPGIAAALQARKQSILHQWELAVERILPDADPLTAKQVRNSIPIVLDQIARALASDQPDETQKLYEVTLKHGVTRFHQAYNVQELIVEYRLLRRIAFEEVKDEMQDQLQLDELMALDIGIDIALQQSVAAFVEYQQNQLNAATEARAKYLSFLSHDLRNHLNGVTLIMEVVAQR